jgi:signal transduction histidine kinase
MTGLSVLPQVPWGSHVCQLYRDAGELVEVAVPYLRTGLEQHERCIWITRAPVSAAEARAALRAAVADLDCFERCGQLQIVDFDDWRRGDDPAEVLHGWLARESEALAAGFRGLRVSGDLGMGWSGRGDYEQQLPDAFAARRIVALCSYPLARCDGADLADLLRHHRFALARRDGAWELLGGVTLADLMPVPVAPGHEVQFYDGTYPAAAIAAFLAGGLAAGRGALVLATATHRDAIAAELGELGHDPAARQCDGQLVFADAQQLLLQLRFAASEPGRPIEELMGPTVERLLARFGGLSCYGEVVQLLASSGRLGQACQLEAQWNVLVAGKPIDLLCGYDLSSFDRDADSAGFRDVCRAHVHVRAGATDEGRRLGPQLATELKHKERVIRAAAAELARLQRVTAALSEAATSPHIAQVVVGDIKAVLGADAALVALVDRAGALELVRQVGFGHAHVDVSAGGGALATTAREGTARWLETRAAVSAELGRIGETAQAAVVLPVGVPGHRLGALLFGFAHARAFSGYERAMVEDLVRQTAVAFDRARLFEEANRALERAEEASRAKDEFLAMLGHELRNPLSPIATALELLKLRAGGAPSGELAIIDRQVQHLVRLVDNLLDVSRVARGKIELSRLPVDLGAVLARAIEAASSLVEQRGHRLDVSLPAAPLRVLGDEARLTQVFTNLLTNAAKYTPPRGRIALAAERDGDTVLVHVSDNGIGIEPGLCERLFGLFVQGRRGPDRSEGGLGLGLALVRSLVELHGGSVDVVSDGPGQGSRFTVRLALLGTEVGPANDTDARRVLIVDDNVDAALLLAELLRLNGHEVAVAHDGPGALEAAARTPFDVAVLDIGLPGMDGYELAHELRVRGGAAAPYLIALTGYGQSQDRRRSAAAGFALHMVKPVDPPALYRAIAAGRRRLH